MPVAAASGSDTTRSNTAKSREHNQGNQDRKYTEEQKAEVLRVRRCSPTAFYDILNLEKTRKTVTDTEIKKAYRRISLLTHPDKNGYKNADEAFKMVSRAFGVLGDNEKRTEYDRYGSDPDSRFGSQQYSSPFSGQGAPRRAGERQEELSAEEMFRRFFGGGSMGGFGRFDNNPGFVFNLGGGPGIRVQQFGGATPLRRRRDANGREEPTASLQQTIMSLLPLLLILFLPILSSLISGYGSTNTKTSPAIRFDSPNPPYTLHRLTNRLGVDYYINPRDVESYTQSQWNYLDNRAEVNYVNLLNLACKEEEQKKQELINQAQGWFFTDFEMMAKASNMPMISCRKLEKLVQHKKF